MRKRSLSLAAAAAAVLLAPHAMAAPSPQVTDPAGDANFLNGQGSVNGLPSVGTPGASQGYADVVSVLWQTYKKSGKFAGFTVTATFSAPPVAPAGSSLVYRMLGQVNGDSSLFLGPVYYTTKGSDPNQPQSALRNNINGATELTPIDLPKISGNTMTWTVPAKVIPKSFKKGSTLSNLYFEVREIEDFHGASVPASVPVYGGATGLAVGMLDNGSSTSSFKVG